MCIRYVWLKILEIKAAFKVFDINSNGQISQDELKEVMRSLKINPSSAMVKNLIQLADKDG